MGATSPTSWQWRVGCGSHPQALNPADHMSPCEEENVAEKVAVLCGGKGRRQLARRSGAYSVLRRHVRRLCGDPLRQPHGRSWPPPTLVLCSVALPPPRPSGCLGGITDDPPATPLCAPLQGSRLVSGCSWSLYLPPWMHTSSTWLVARDSCRRTPLWASGSFCALGWRFLLGASGLGVLLVSRQPQLCGPSWYLAGAARGKVAWQGDTVA